MRPVETPGKDFGPWLRRKLVERHISLAELCRRAGCSYTYLWRILNRDMPSGKRYQRPSYTLTRKIGEILEAPKEALTAAGFEVELGLEEAQVADRLKRLERDLAELREGLDPRASTPPERWGLVRLPLLGHVQAGALKEAIENPGELLELPEFVGRDAHYAVYVQGDSMSPTLLQGDLIAVKLQSAAQPGQLVVAAVDEETTLKRYEVVDGVPTLVADNPEWKPLPCGPRVRIIGVVTGSFRPPEVLLRRPHRYD